MASLKRQAISGMIWASIGSVGGGILNLLVMFILARLLEPSDFGVMELLVVVTSVSTVLVDSGFSQALIRDKNATDIDCSTVFYINLSISTFLYLLLFAAAPLLSVFFHLPEFTNYSRVAFLCIIIDSVAVIQNIKYTKDVNFRPIAISILCGVVVAGILTISLSKMGMGTWALVFFILINSLVKSTCLWILSRWRPMWAFSTISMKKYWRFGSFVLLQSLIDKIAMDVESLLIGRVYTKSQLGFFSQSRKINSYFGQALTSVVVKVSYPVLVKIGDTDEQLKAGYRKIMGYTTFVIAPIMVFIFCFPYETMHALFGEKWIEAGAYLRLFSCVGLITPMQSICHNIFLVKGKSKLFLYISAAKNFSKIAVVSVLVFIGIYQMLIGIVCVAILTAIVAFYYSGRLINYSFTALLSDILPNILFSAISCIFVYFIVTTTHLSDLQPLFKIILFFSFNLVFYLLINLLSHNSNMIDLLAIAKSLIRK